MSENQQMLHLTTVFFPDRKSACAYLCLSLAQRLGTPVNSNRGTLECPVTRLSNLINGSWVPKHVLFTCGDVYNHMRLSFVGRRVECVGVVPAVSFYTFKHPLLSDKVQDGQIIHSDLVLS